MHPEIANAKNKETNKQININRQNTYYWVVYLHTVVHKQNQAYNKPNVIHFIYFNSLEIYFFFPLTGEVWNAKSVTKGNLL